MGIEPGIRWPNAWPQATGQSKGIGGVASRDLVSYRDSSFTVHCHPTCFRKIFVCFPLFLYSPPSPHQAICVPPPTSDTKVTIASAIHPGLPVWPSHPQLIEQPSRLRTHPRASQPPCVKMLSRASVPSRTGSDRSRSAPHQRGPTSTPPPHAKILPRTNAAVTFACSSWRHVST